MMTTPPNVTMISNQPLKLSTAMNPRRVIQRMVEAKMTQRLAKLYSKILESHVAPRTALHILHAQTAFCLLWMPVSLPIFLHIVLTAWTVLAATGAWRSFREGGGRLR